MSDDPRRQSGDDLRELARRDVEIAEEARDDAALVRDAQASPGERPAYPLGLGVNDSPAVERADRVRREDDERTFERQERLAEAGRESAETLEENADALRRARSELDRMEARVEENEQALEEMEEDARELRKQIDRTNQAARDIDPGPVDR